MPGERVQFMFLEEITVGKERTSIYMAPFIPCIVSKRSDMNHAVLSANYTIPAGRKEEYLYSAFYILCISQSAQAWITQFYQQIHHA